MSNIQFSLALCYAISWQYLASGQFLLSIRVGANVAGMTWATLIIDQTVALFSFYLKTFQPAYFIKYLDTYIEY
jgi:hypothetical protein